MTMTTSDITTLLSDLDHLDTEEDGVLADLIRRGLELEEARRRDLSVTVGDLRSLRDALGHLGTAIDEVQATAVRAEATAAGTPPAATPAPAPPAAPAVDPAAVAPVPATAVPSAPPTPAPAPAPAPTFEELAAQARELEAAQERMRALMRERMRELGAIGSEAPAPVAAGGAPVVAPATEPSPASSVPVTSSAPVTNAVTGNGVAAPVVGTLPEIAIPRKRRTFRRGTDKAIIGDDVMAFQRCLNRRFAAWGIAPQVREDGRYGDATYQAARRALHALGLNVADMAHGITPPLRDIVRDPDLRSDEQRQRAAGRRAWLRSFRKSHPLDGHASSAKPHSPKGPAHRPGMSSPAGGTDGVAAAIRRHGGRYADIIVREARRNHLPVSLVCGVVDVESHFRNVYGHDAVPNPIKSPANGLLQVTEENYKEYLRHRKMRQGAQGVGPMQLTDPGLQDRADKAGGCWKVSTNIAVGCAHLAQLRATLGHDRGVRAYNDGSGTVAASKPYLAKVAKAEAQWRAKLAGAKVSSRGVGVGGGASSKSVTAHKPPTFRLTKTPMHGDDVRRFQHELNRRFEVWKVATHINEDGVYGRSTRQAARQVLFGLGISANLEFPGGITPGMRSLIRHPDRRSAKMRELERKRAPFLADLRKHAARKPASKMKSLKARAGNAASRAKHGIRINGNVVTGGTPRQRVVAAARHAAWLDMKGKRPSFYSQTGSWDVKHGITGESRGCRSDCSQWVTAMYHSAGVRDPNGTGYTRGYTGTLSAQGKRISQAQLKPGDLVLYGPGTHHHVEMYIGPGIKTIGHGSRHVDAGTVGMMRDAHFVTYPWLD
jgi:cell wall-associated NlpC family hydrolase